MTKRSDVSAEAKAQAEALADDPPSAAKDHAEAAFNDAAGRSERHARQASDAAGPAGAAFDPGNLQAQAAGQVAAQLEAMADRVREADLNQTVRSVSDFARQNPALFLGAAALAGFAATRFLKSSDPRPSPAARPAPRPEPRPIDDPVNTPVNDPWALDTSFADRRAPGARSHPNTQSLEEHRQRAGAHHARMTNGRG